MGLYMLPRNEPSCLCENLLLLLLVCWVIYAKVAGVTSSEGSLVPGSVLLMGASVGVWDWSLASCGWASSAGSAAALRCLSTASAIGIIIAVVAVLLIHIDRNAVVDMNPIISLQYTHIYILAPRTFNRRHFVQRTAPTQCHYRRAASALTLTLTFENLTNSSVVNNLPIPRIFWKSSPPITISVLLFAKKQANIHGSPPTCGGGKYSSWGSPSYHLWSPFHLPLPSHR